MMFKIRLDTAKDSGRVWTVSQSQHNVSLASVSNIVKTHARENNEQASISIMIIDHHIQNITSKFSLQRNFQHCELNANNIELQDWWQCAALCCFGQWLSRWWLVALALTQWHPGTGILYNLLQMPFGSLHSWAQNAAKTNYRISSWITRIISTPPKTTQQI